MLIKSAVIPILLVFLLSGCGTSVPETPPQQKEGSPFHYPEDLWDQQIEGETVLRLFVTEAGRVDTVLVERSSGYEQFDEAATSGARDLLFDPARRGDEPIGKWVLLPVQFELPDTVKP